MPGPTRRGLPSCLFSPMGRTALGSLADVPVLIDQDGVCTWRLEFERVGTGASCLTSPGVRHQGPCMPQRGHFGTLQRRQTVGGHPCQTLRGEPPPPPEPAALVAAHRQCGPARHRVVGAPLEQVHVGARCGGRCMVTCKAAAIGICVDSPRNLLSQALCWMRVAGARRRNLVVAPHASRA